MTETRTTKRAAALLPGERVVAAVPIESGVAPPEEPGGLVQRVLSRRAGQGVLAFTADSTVVFSSRSDNPGLPNQLLERHDGPAELLDDDRDSVRLRVGSRELVVGRLHRMSVLDAIAAQAVEDDAAVAEVAIAESDREVVAPNDDGPTAPDEALEVDRSVFGNRTTTMAQKLAPDAGLLHAVPATDESGEPVIVALAPRDTVLFDVTKRNAARPKQFRQVIQGPRSFDPDRNGGGTLRVSERSFGIGRLHRRGVETFLRLPDPAADLAAPPDSKWATVARAFVEELKLPPELLDTPVDDRSRTTVQCQRLLREHHVTLAVPVTPSDGTDLRGGHVIALTTGGPYLFRSSRGNPALPRDVVGLIENASPMSFSPHEREGGVLSLGSQEFIVPIAHAPRLRELIHALSEAEADPQDDSPEEE